MFAHTRNRLKLFVLASWIVLFLFWLICFEMPSLPSYARYYAGRTALIPNAETTPDVLEEHPIQALVRDAEAEFEKLLERQSRTLETATSAYSQRYHRDPPPGFAIWYEYAVRHDSLIIDDFNIINETLSPFWALDGAEVRRRMSDVRKDGGAIAHCEVSGGHFNDGCQPLGEKLLEWLNHTTISSQLPDMELLLNVLDEPRVLAGGHDARADGSASNETVVWTDDSHVHIWDKLTATCDYRPDPEAQKSPITDRQTQTPAWSFSDGRPSTLDLCQHPEYKHIHGFWDSPSNFQTTNSAVPILSAAVLSTMGDIPIPAAAYTHGMYSYDEIEDIPWENKTAGLYWAGKTTGSLQGVTDQDWKHHHRQRFVALVNELENRTHAYLERSNDGRAWEHHTSSALNSSLYHVHFTDVVQYENESTNAAIREYFTIHEAEPRSESFRYTLDFDLDGNGHSGRYYRLLDSNSLPLKQTVLREWHDERLQGWLHYVPISLGMQELPEVIRYLTEEEEGRALAASMAEKGRRWSMKALRPVDQVIYLYRLMLELARVQDPERPVGS